MADVSVNFMHPTDGRIMTVTVDDSMTAEEAIGELLASNFVPPHPSGYELVAGSARVGPGQTLADAGVKDGTKIRVNPATDAGTSF